ncbi:MAG TPA: hypothetical protein PLH43_04890 [Acetivibrio sp.]|uniref:hypothetical protein n=1 Tax=Acetivibrio sp. TaxID=1872092 RepID=UPI002BFAEC09|nr:hypothetical protein [Acetivibrio sp.]HOM02146.1 hypothetical protein [Acetivibrio sp.]
MNIIEDSRYANEALFTKKNLVYMLEAEEFQIMFKGYFSVSEPEERYIKFKHGNKLVNLYFYDINDNNIEDLEMEYIDWYLNKIEKINLDLAPKLESVNINGYRADKAVIEIKKEKTEIYFIEVNEKLVIFQTWFDRNMLPEEKEDIYMIINSFVEKDKASVYQQTFEHYNTPQYIDSLAANFKSANKIWDIFTCVYFVISIGVAGFTDIYLKQDILLKNKEYMMFKSPVPNMFFELVLFIFISAAIFGIIVKKIIAKFSAEFIFNLSKINKNYASYRSKGIKGEIFALIICLPLLIFSFTTYTYIDNEYIYDAGFFDIKAIPKYDLSYIKRIENRLIYYKSDKELNYYIQIELENGKKFTENNYLTSIYLDSKDKEWVTESRTSKEIKLKNKEKVKKLYYLVEKVKSANENVEIQKGVEDSVTAEVIEAAKRELEISKDEEKYLTMYGISDE